MSYFKSLMRGEKKGKKKERGNCSGGMSTNSFLFFFLFFLKGIGKGQTLELFIIPEVKQLIGASTKRSQRAPLQNYLAEVVAWLVNNSIKSEAVQFSILNLFLPHPNSSPPSPSLPSPLPPPPPLPSLTPPPFPHPPHT